jgi:hypothetical protein
MKYFFIFIFCFLFLCDSFFTSSSSQGSEDNDGFVLVENPDDFERVSSPPTLLSITRNGQEERFNHLKKMLHGQGESARTIESGAKNFYGNLNWFIEFQKSQGGCEPYHYYLRHDHDPETEAAVSLDLMQANCHLQKALSDFRNVLLGRDPLWDGQSSDNELLNFLHLHYKDAVIAPKDYIKMPLCEGCQAVIAHRKKSLAERVAESAFSGASSLGSSFASMAADVIATGVDLASSVFIPTRDAAQSGLSAVDSQFDFGFDPDSQEVDLEYTLKYLEAFQFSLSPKGNDSEDSDC